MVLRVVILSLMCLFSTDTIYETNRKKVDKILAKNWPEIDYQVELQLPIQGLKGEYLKVFAKDSLIAHIIIDEAFGKVSNFSYMVVFNCSGEVNQVRVLQYRENYGGEIASKRFLKQYVGKQNGISMEYTKDIDGISGATISVRAINHGIKENSKQLYQLINNK